MRRSITRLPLLLAATLPVLAACGSPPPPEPPPAAVLPPAPETAAPTPPPPPAPPEPTAEEKKKAQAARDLADMKAAFEAKHKAEVARWTPELHAEAKKLSDKAYPTLKSAFDAILPSKVRKPDNAERDKYRHPKETFEFLGLKPNMTVLEVGPGEAWVTEIIAPALAAKGKLLVTTGDVNGPADQYATFGAQRLKAIFDTSPELYGKVNPVVVDQKSPSLGLEGTVDMVLVFRGMHGMQNNGVLDAWLAEIHKALKNNGILGVEQHRAKEGDDPATSAKAGYLPEKWLIERIESAGFKLAGKSEVNANPKDTKDHPEGVWTLPPSLKLKDKDREKYLAIGESDRSTLKFTKVAAKADAAKPAEKK